MQCIDRTHVDPHVLANSSSQNSIHIHIKSTKSCTCCQRDQEKALRSRICAPKQIWQIWLSLASFVPCLCQHRNRVCCLSYLRHHILFCTNMLVDSNIRNNSYPKIFYPYCQYSTHQSNILLLDNETNPIHQSQRASTAAVAIHTHTSVQFKVHHAIYNKST